MKVYLPSPEIDRQVEARGLRNDTNTQEERREKHLEPTGKMDTQWLEESCKHHTVVSVNLHCKAMQEAGSWQGDHARNGTETSGLLGGGHRLVKGGRGVRFLGNRREESKGGGNGSWLAMP